MREVYSGAVASIQPLTTTTPPSTVDFASFHPAANDFVPVGSTNLFNSVSSSPHGVLPPSRQDIPSLLQLSASQQVVQQPLVVNLVEESPSLLQLSASQQVVQQPLVANMVGLEAPMLGVDTTLNIDAEAFIPVPGGDIPGNLLNAERDVIEILNDHSEVERVVLGGLGTALPTPTSWQVVQQNLSLPLMTVDGNLVDELPFSSSKSIPSSSSAAMPVVRTNSLKEYTVKFNGQTFVDRCLPKPSSGINPHNRFTPVYYVALHNLVANGGHDGNGFWYPPNTPNYKGARIPLVHTGLNIKNWRRHLIGYGESNELMQFMEFGFPLGLKESPVLSPCSRNHGSAYQFFPHIDKFITAEITRGGLTGPFTSPPWPGLMLSPLMTAPKKPDSRRPVFDATFGEFSLNNSTPIEHYLGTPTVYTYPKIDDFRRILLACGEGCFMWKRDLHRFYLQIPMDPVEFQYVGCVWRGLFFFFVALMFGLRHSGLQGQRVTDALSWIHRRAGLDTPEDRLFFCINYCDDLGGAESSKERSCDSFSKLGDLLSELGLAEATDKARAPDTDMVYLGVQFNTVSMTTSVPPDKLAEENFSGLVEWSNIRACSCAGSCTS